MQRRYYAGHSFLLCMKMTLSPQCKWSQDLAAMLEDVLLAGAQDPTDASALNTITLNIQQ